MRTHVLTDRVVEGMLRLARLSGAVKLLPRLAPFFLAMAYGRL